MKLEEIIVPLIKYLFTLKFKDSLLYTSIKKTFILGFAIAVNSVLSLSKQLFTQHTNFSYILTYKFSQDPLELLFGRIRQRFGSNNNPNVFQFKTAIKQILMKNSIKYQSNFNCNFFDDEPIDSLFEYKWSKKKKEIDYEKEVAIDEIDDIALKKKELLNSYDSSHNICQLQDAEHNILYYIAGYIVKKIDLDCFSCTNSLYKKPNEHNY